MQMRPEVQLAAMIKALTDVVIPSVPKENKLAVEQASLVVGMLKLMQDQLPIQFRFDRDELRRLVDTAARLAAVRTTDAATSAAIEHVGVPCDRAAGVLERSQAGPQDLHASILEMRTALCALIDVAANSADIGGRDQIESILMSMSREQLLRDRALMKPQRWEPNPASLPDIGCLISS